LFGPGIWHISCIHVEVIANFTSKLSEFYYINLDNLDVATMISRGSIWLTLFNCQTLETPCLMLKSAACFLYKLRYGIFCKKIPQISLPWQLGSVSVKFEWHHSIAWPWKHPFWCKNLALIVNTSQNMAILSKFPKFRYRGNQGRSV